MRNALTDFILEFGEKPYGTVDNKLACHRVFFLNRRAKLGNQKTPLRGCGKIGGLAFTS